MKRVTSGTVDVNPEYQRETVWTAEKQSALIDSIFRRCEYQCPKRWQTEQEYGFKVELQIKIISVMLNAEKHSMDPYHKE